MTRTLLLVGGTGKIGSALVELLRPAASTGQLSIRIATRNPERCAALLGPGIQARRLPEDPLDRSAVHEALEGCNGLFLLTGYTVDMLAQSKRLLDAAQSAGVEQVVHVGVHGRPDTVVPHIGWHQYIERYIEHLGFSWTHLNPNWYLQNLLRFTDFDSNGCLRVRNYLPPELPLSWIDVRDVAAVAAQILRDPASHAGRTYPLASLSMCFADVATALGSALAVACRYEEIDSATFRAQRAKPGRDRKYEDSIRVYYEAVRAGLVPECAEVFEIATLLKRAPFSVGDFALLNSHALLGR
jgi:NAD(P)H dehydrogenase (quinone)